MDALRRRASSDSREFLIDMHAGSHGWFSYWVVKFPPWEEFYDTLAIQVLQLQQMIEDCFNIRKTRFWRLLPNCTGYLRLRNSFYLLSELWHEIKIYLLLENLALGMSNDSILADIAENPDDITQEKIETAIEEISTQITELDNMIDEMSETRTTLERKREKLRAVLELPDVSESLEMAERLENFVEEMESQSGTENSDGVTDE